MSKWWIKETGTTVGEWNRGLLARLLGASIGPEPAGLVTINGKQVFPLTDAGLNPPTGQQLASRTVTDDGAVATAAYVYEDIALAVRKTAMKAQATALFQTKRDAGTTITIGAVNYALATTNDAAVELREALDKIQTTSPEGIDIVTRAGAAIALTEPIAKAMIAAIQVHVAACQEVESTLHAAVDAGANSDALDLINEEAGSVSGSGSWPVLVFDAAAHAAAASITEERRLAKIAALTETVATLPEDTATERAIKDSLAGLVSAM